MSGFVAQLQPKSMLMSLAPLAIKGHVDSSGLGQHLGLGLCPRIMLQLDHANLVVLGRHLGPWWTSRSGLQPRTMFVSVVITQAGSLLKFVTHVAPGSMQRLQPVPLVESGDHAAAGAI